MSDRGSRGIGAFTLTVAWLLLAAIAADGVAGPDESATSKDAPPRIVDAMPGGVLTQHGSQYESYVIDGSTMASTARVPTQGPYDDARCMDGCRGVVVSELSGSRVDADAPVVFADASDVVRRTVHGRSPGGGGKRQVLHARSTNDVVDVYSDLDSTARLRVPGAEPLDLETFAPEVEVHRSADGSAFVVQWDESSKFGSRSGGGAAVVRSSGGRLTAERLPHIGRVGCVSADGSTATIARGDRHVDIVGLVPPVADAETIEAVFSSRAIVIRDRCVVTADAVVIPLAVGGPTGLVTIDEIESTVAVFRYRRVSPQAQPEIALRVKTTRIALDPNGCCVAWLDDSGLHLRRWSSEEQRDISGEFNDLAFLGDSDGKLVVLDRAGTPQLATP